MGEEASTLAEFLDKTTKVVTLPKLGLKIRIVRLSPWDFIVEGESPPGFSDEKARAEAIKEKSKNPEWQREMIAKILNRAILSPKTTMCPISDTPADRLNVTQLGNDALFLFEEIMKFAGLGQGVDQSGDLFRKEESASGDRPDGEAIRNNSGEPVKDIAP